ncbi:hypothetical protein PVL29_019122 [Vitis rotundifolia]|uniref:Uncharacterized protein n=1 Tax=Vitis rotundifolia TaxID=103349 RepID=A0AA38Z6M8_VITRO|nr:hypothetical protein PVL29_019122 [Vitis rotundifolia]
MASITRRRFLQPIKASLDAIAPCYSSPSHSAFPFYGRFGPLKTLIKDLEPVLYKRASRFHDKLNIQRTYLKNFCFRGSKLSMGSIFGVSVVFGSINLWPHFVYAMDGHDILAGDYHVDSLGVSDLEQGPHTFWMLAKKLWLPFLFFVTVLVNWEHPIKLVIKATIFLLATKPGPFSVYLSVEQLRHQSMRQHPYFYKFKSLYAKKVEVRDYKLFCIAKVELRDKEFELVGILGGWWVLPSSLPAIARFI